MVNDSDNESLLSDSGDLLVLRDDPLDEAKNFFLAHSKRPPTSSANLDDLDLPSMAKVKQLCDAGDSLKVHKKELLKKYGEEHFEKWFYALNSGFNVMLYGLGSKRALLEAFKQEWLFDEHVLVLLGFFTHLSLRQIVAELSRAFGSETTITDEQRLFETINESDHDAYIVFHSADVVLSQGNSGLKIKAFFSRLLTNCAEKIHIIASSDHVNSGLLWGTHELHIFRWLSFNCPTLESYWAEKTYSAGYDTKSGASGGSFSLTNHLSANLTLSSIEHVYESLTPNAQKIFQIILRHYEKQTTSEKSKKSGRKTPPGSSRRRNTQESDSDDDSSGSDEELHKSNNAASAGTGLTFAELYRECREQFLVNSELTLRAQLVEFKDHKLIKLRKASSDGAETVNLLLASSVITKFLSTIG